MLGLELTPYDPSQLKEFAQTLSQEDGNLYQVVIIDDEARLSRFRMLPMEGVSIDH